MCSGRVPPPPGKACAAYWNKILVDLGPLPRKMGLVRESWSTLFYRIGLQDGFSHAYLKCSFRWETRSPSYVAVGHARVVGDIKTANNWSSSSSFDSKICATDTSLILNTLRRMVWTLFTCQVCVDTPLYCVSWKPRACVISLKEYPNDRRRERVCYAYAVVVAFKKCTLDCWDNRKITQHRTNLLWKGCCICNAICLV